MNAAPYDILKKDALGNPIWVEAVEDLPKATVRMEELALHSPGEYIVFNQRTKQIVIAPGGSQQSPWKNMDDNDFPICPKHNKFMVEYSFEPWEVLLPQGTLEVFRCPNLECLVVYITGAAEGLYVIEPRSTLTPYSNSGQ